jgi:ribosomal protein L24E
MPKCTYCNKEYKFPKGISVVDSIKGEIKYYCSSKCRKNAEMKRKKRKWAIPKEGEYTEPIEEKPEEPEKKPEPKKEKKEEKKDEKK